MFDFIYKTIFLLNRKNDDEQYMTQLLYKDMRNFRFASQRLKQDHHFILAFLKKDYISMYEKINAGFIVRQNSYEPKTKVNKYVDWLFIYCDEELKNTKNFVFQFLTHIQWHGYFSFTFYDTIPIKFRTDPNFWKEFILYNNSELLFFCWAQKKEEVFKHIKLDEHKFGEEFIQDILSQLEILIEKEQLESFIPNPLLKANTKKI